MSFETTSVHGEEFQVVPSQQGLPMPRELFISRFKKAIDRCMDLTGLSTQESMCDRKLSFGLEQCPYNGDQLFADEVVLAPNRGCFIADNLTEHELLSKLWRFGRCPRYVHVGVERHADDEIYFLLQMSCCLQSVYDPAHPNPCYPMRPLGWIASLYRPA